MSKYLKTILTVIIGSLIGLIIHGAIEIPIIFLLTGPFENLFLSVSWNAWILVHHIFTIIIEVFGIVLAFWAFKKFNMF